jgi:hypothetical protein
MEEPHNFRALTSKIAAAQPDDDNRERDIIEYKRCIETTSISSYSAADATSWCQLYLYTRPLRLDKPHFKAEKIQFVGPQGSQIFEYTPEPNHTE